MATRQTTHDDTNVAAPRVSQRALTIGLCATIVAIAFEAISVATAMPVAARDLDGLRYYAWAFSAVLDRNAVCHCGVWQAQRSDRPRQTAARRSCDLSGWPSRIRHGSAYGPTARRPTGTGTRQRHHERRDLRLCRAGFQPSQRPKIFTYISTAWVLPSFVGPPAAAWLTETLELALGVSRGDSCGPLRCRNGPAEPVAHDALPPATHHRWAQRPAPLWAAGLVCLATAALQLAGQRLDWIGLGLLVGGLAMLLVSLPQLMPPGFLRFRRGLSQVIQTRGLLPGAFFGAEAFVPLMLVEQRSVPLVQAGAVLTVGAVGWTAGSGCSPGRGCESGVICSSRSGAVRWRSGWRC